jgi:hypothetical protein
MFANMTETFVMGYRPVVRAKLEGDKPVSKKQHAAAAAAAASTAPAKSAGAADFVPIPQFPFSKTVADKQDADDEEEEDDGVEDEEGNEKDEDNEDEEEEENESEDEPMDDADVAEGQELLAQEMKKRVDELAKQDSIFPQYVLYPNQSTREGCFRGSNVFESNTVAKPRLDKAGVPVRTGKLHSALLHFSNDAVLTSFQPLLTGEKDQDLLRELCELYTTKNDTVFDPAFGTGSMMEAAVSLGRHFVGWENDILAYKVRSFALQHEKRCFTCHTH